ncbi:pre-mRNA-splicing factor syf2-like [Styela clava]|uniref:pre-mRNA-splicing factor syf2-like n=1 Tax=Styela clava TaxID=7725 RepID=UPI00193AA7C9|nr:pre-mRNA-splicing factor syf2-like [Styela clava]
MEEASTSSTNVEEDVSKIEDAQSKKQQRLERLRDLKMRRNEARKLNRAEVVEEDRRSKLPVNWENRKKKAEWELAEIEKKKQCEEDGEEYDRVKLLNVSAIDAERIDKFKRRKKNPDQGFSTYEEASARQNRRLVGQIKPNMEAYEKQRQQVGDDIFYANVNTILPGKVKDTPEALTRLVEDLEKQKEKSKRFHRRRFFNDDKDVDYINERNSKFNAKAERFYGKYTAEIKQNLERGTAV